MQQKTAASEGYGPTPAFHQLSKRPVIEVHSRRAAGWRILGEIETVGLTAKQRPQGEQSAMRTQVALQDV
jgi:hypothetical protein